jgi:hypothetical protein
MKKVSAVVLGFAMAVGATLFATDGRAGLQEPVPSPYCYKNSDGSGGCYANQLGFRASSDPNAWSDFIMVPYQIAYEAYLNGVSYMCTVPSSSSLYTTMAPLVVNTNGWFNVNWTSSGTCDNFSMSNSSYYAQSF